MTATLLTLPTSENGRSDAALGDLRFRALLSRETWERLPAEVRKRFSKRLEGAQAALYRGHVVAMEMPPAGRLLSQLCRLFGSPLPLDRSVGGGAFVMVSEEPASGGQCWTRVYARPRQFPQVIHSAKRFSGATGLEEYLGRGLGMALRLEALDDGIAFVSDHYFLSLRGRRLRLPRFLSPGTTRVSHRQVAGSSFLFELDVRHPLAGLLLNQQILFDDVE
jgi:hypothetical protein